MGRVLMNIHIKDMSHTKAVDVYASDCQTVFVCHRMERGITTVLYIGTKDDMKIQKIRETVGYKDGGTKMYRTTDGNVVYMSPNRSLVQAYVFDFDKKFILSEPMKGRCDATTGNIYILP